MSEIILSRFSITGYIDLNTPKIVIEEIAKSHKIYFYGNIDKISKRYELIFSLINTEVCSVKYPYNEFELREISNFVNYNIDFNHWDKKLLIKAFEYLMNFKNIKDPNFILISNINNFGLQTNNNIKSLNSCVLYRLCKLRNIKTSYNFNINDMIELLTIYELKKKSIKKEIINILLSNDNNKSSLVNSFEILFNGIIDSNINSLTFMKSKEYIDKECYYKIKKYRKLEYSIDEINKIPKFKYKLLERLMNFYREKKIFPLNIKSIEEAIVIARLYYNIDISISNDPLKEIELLKNNKYIPEGIIKKRILDPHDSPYFNKSFNPNLPRNFYTFNQLKYLSFNQGFYNISSDINYDKIYSQLQNNSLIKTFYHGKTPFYINKSTYITLEKVKNIENKDCVSFGVWMKKKHIFLYKELLDTFKFYMCFRNPSENKISFFSNSSIRKLEHICLYKGFKNNDDINNNIKIELLNIITKIKKSFKNLTKEQILLKNTYKLLNDKNKEKVKKAFNSLFYLSMYMRSWDGKSDFPISSTSNSIVKNQNKIDLNITREINKFEKLAKDLLSLEIEILKLPIYQYDDGFFIKSNDIESGFTIEDRLKIVKEGKSIFSCVRMSSNWFASTYYKYMEILELEKLFDINKLKRIF